MMENNAVMDVLKNDWNNNCKQPNAKCLVGYCYKCGGDSEAYGCGNGSAMLDHILPDFTGKKSPDPMCNVCAENKVAVAYCSECKHNLCEICELGHLDSECTAKYNASNIFDHPIHRISSKFCCFVHPQQEFRYFCMNCKVPVCGECVLAAHPPSQHSHVEINEVAYQEARANIGELRDQCNEVLQQIHWQIGIHKSKDFTQAKKNLIRSQVEEAFNDCICMLSRHKDSVLAKLDEYVGKQGEEFEKFESKVTKNVADLEQAIAYSTAVLERCKDTELLVVLRMILNRLKPLVSERIEPFLLSNGPTLQWNRAEFETALNSHLRVQMLNNAPTMMQAPARMAARNWQNGTGTVVPMRPNKIRSSPPLQLETDFNSGEAIGSRSPGLQSPKGRFTFSNSFSKLPASRTILNASPEFNSLNGEAKVGYQGGALHPPMRTGTRMNPMKILYKFGALGPASGQFHSPHGFCLTKDGEILVADTNNHRIQCFRMDGTFITEFGIPGKEEGQLLFPRKVGVLHSNGNILVIDRGSERSRLQVFTKKGEFVRKIPIRFVDIAAGMTVTDNDEIVVVDSVSPTVFRITEFGELKLWFDCAAEMREPSDIVVHGSEYYICDFKGHCVVVYDHNGKFSRRVGCETITNYPNGIDVSDDGDVLIGDSHGNRFHVAVFDKQNGLSSEHECCSIKVSRCCGLKITPEGYIITLAKNNNAMLVLDTLFVKG